jgi:hypothetical protein
MEFSRQNEVSSSIYWQHDLSLKNEPPFCLYFFMNHHLCVKPLVTIADAKCPTFLVMNQFRNHLWGPFLTSLMVKQLFCNSACTIYDNTIEIVLDLNNYLHAVPYIILIQTCIPHPSTMSSGSSWWYVHCYRGFLSNWSEKIFW